LLLRVGNDRTLAIPTGDIITSTLFASLQAQTTGSNHPFYSWQITNGNFTEPGLDLFDYWQGNLSLRTPSETAVAVYIGSAEGAERAWVIADELLGKTELLINPLPSPLVSPVGLIGLSLQYDGGLIPVLDAVTIAQYLVKEGEIVEQSTVATLDKMTSFLGQEGDSKQVILVVDDAALMRRRIEASLTAHGYEVQTCVDGLDAWNWLQHNPSPLLILTDIEMPNMDGFTLISRCRQNEMKIPIVVISSRLSQEWGAEAKRLGATDYLTKGFSTTELIDKVKSLVP
jgi:chemosensory pili system protein ChpA (sensor histidine kinase/response regulator)